MNYRVDFHKDVEKDYLEAFTWYENNKIGLGERFLIKVREKLSQIAANPEAFSQKIKSNYREAAVEVFPYTIIYKLYKKEKVIFIVSVVHQKKHPRKRYRK